MSFIETISKADATGTTKEIYDAAEASSGYIPHYAELFGQRPEVYKAWQSLIAAIRKNLRLRRYELVTLAAARELGCTYCMLAHGDVILNAGEVDEAQLIAIANDYHSARLAPDEMAVMDFTTKVIRHASTVTQADVDQLKGFGLTDADILDITLAAAARSFFSKTLDALNAEPDAKYHSLSPELRAALALGRPFA
ncbi:MAG: peroxidase-related enzyme [Chloroflexi bacterium]|nr:peroxidase-related enzyme [Chloroflexota bacterium]